MFHVEIFEFYCSAIGPEGSVFKKSGLHFPDLGIPRIRVHEFPYVIPFGSNDAYGGTPFTSNGVQARCACAAPIHRRKVK